MENLQDGAFCRIAVSFPQADSVLTYKIPEGIEARLGELVEVPLGRRKSKGCIVELDLKYDDLSDTEKKYDIKSYNDVLDGALQISSLEMQLYQWMSRYYHYSLGQLIFDCLPKSMKRPRDCEFLQGAGVPFEGAYTETQKKTIEALTEKLDLGFNSYYLHGVTGSGKTVIYLDLINKVLEKGKSVLFLLPEINLTPQFSKTLSRHVKAPLLSYHSGLTNSEKYQVWKTLKESDEPHVILGVRSSVFLPIEPLGLVIVDEEHDSSFKQSDRCPYNGRDVAIKKAQLADCPVVMGSATPTMENYQKYAIELKDSGRYFPLPERVLGCFPEIEILDARERLFDETKWPLIDSSVDAIAAALEKKEQVLVFVNRLGFANFLQCPGCGHHFKDPNTETPLRYFKAKNMLVSAHSDYKIPLPDICPECDNMNLHQKGFGTEKVQEVLQGLFPDKVIDRFDRDEIKNATQLEEKLDRFNSGQTDIFVGTQMLSKGHNFKKVNTVVVLGVDHQLNFPDFRAIEKTYQTITQVAGRAGRFSGEAKVLIQTLSPELDMFEKIQQHSFNGFHEQELAIRKMSNFPPFSRMATIALSSRFRDRVMDSVSRLAATLRQLSGKNRLAVTILGPTPAAIERKSGQFSWVIAMTAGDMNQLHSLLNFVHQDYSFESGVSFKIDVDPLNIL